MKKRIWIEAESVESLGGWLVDSQSMEEIGSAYIMAHGMGTPVADAERSFKVKEDGTYHVWARTRDWTAVWKRGTPAGQFKLIINGLELPEVLGTNGVEWSWQKAGIVTLEKGTSKIAFHDLTGFNGRCDAVYLSNDPNDIPPENGEKLAEFRHELSENICIDDPVEYDLLVAGGGFAGICTALAAIRSGLKVALIHDRDVLGGCNSSEVRVGIGGHVNVEPYPALGRTVLEIAPVMGGPGTYPAHYYEDQRKENVFRLHHPDSYRLALNERVISLEKDADNTIVSVTTRHTRSGQDRRYRAKIFSDCTGDAVLARKAGAELMYGREEKSRFNESLGSEKPEKQVMGMSVLWFSRKENEASSFPEIDWGIPVTEDTAYYIRGGDWEWETGQYRDQAKESEYIRDYGMMATYANWSFLKNRSARKNEWADEKLNWVSSVGGKRESYRVIGDYILTQNDIENQTVHEDATASMTWSIDLHFPDPENEAKFKEPFRSCAYHRGIGKSYPVPFRCLYAKGIKNLLLGGRHISMSHVAFSCVRVMRTLGMLGEVSGLAASVCAKEGIYPAELYREHFNKLKELMKEGVPLPAYHAYWPDRSETYHFKELGFISTKAEDKAELLKNPEVLKRIKRLKMSHMYQNPAFD